ncbi:MAG: hypothetical protein ACRBCJ_11105 [Hyphomicrobiaceae bacterium]
MKRASLALLTCIAVIIAASPIQAADPAFVGTWGKDIAQCAISQEVQGAPIVYSKDGYDQHEAHCKFKTINQDANKWNITAACSVEGDEQTEKFTIVVKDTTLTTINEYGKYVLIRCP